MTLDLSIPPKEFVFETDESYQTLFQKFFQFQFNIDELDDVYDVQQVREGMNIILSKTSDVDEWWKKLYLKAASIFLSEDPEMGLCVCLNYSYFQAFYKVYYCLEREPENIHYEKWKQELECLVFDT